MFSATYYIDNKNLSLVLYFISSVFVSIAGAIFYDTYKQISGDTVLVKKGQGAVRSLFLIVEKIKNISDVSNKRKNVDEIINLLGLVEKDVTNSIQEWTDVIPGLAYIEVSQKIIEEKEIQKAEIQSQYNEAITNLQQAKATEANKDKEVEAQKEKIAELNKILENKERELRELKLERDIAISKNIGSSNISLREVAVPPLSALERINAEAAITLRQAKKAISREELYRAGLLKKPIDKEFLEKIKSDKE